MCIRDRSKEGFDALNSDLREAAKNANTYANVLMPVMNNLSYVNYALVAAVGCLLYTSAEQRTCQHGDNK